MALEISPSVDTNFVPFARSVGAAYSWQPVFGKVSVGTDIFFTFRTGIMDGWYRRPVLT